MGRLVCVLAMTHNPRIFASAAVGGAAEGDTGAVGAAGGPEAAAALALFSDLGRRLASARPDRLVVVANDHLNNFSLDLSPAFCVGVGTSCEGPFWYEEELMRVPHCRPDLDAGLARDLLQVCAAGGPDLAQTHDFRLDHAFCVPLALLRPASELPIVPVFTNTFAYPLPSAVRFFALGRAIAELVRCRPAAERLAVLTSFNLSLEVGGPLMGRRDDAFNEQALRWMRAGDAASIVALPVDRLLAAGNSTAEFLNYSVALGLVGHRVPDCLEFVRVPAWGDCPAAMWSLDGSF